MWVIKGSVWGNPNVARTDIPGSLGMSHLGKSANMDIRAPLPSPSKDRPGH